jgi:Fur family transcriptional regulator, ferric uptake regulator
MDKIQSANEVIQQRGLRPTSRRRLVFEILQESHEHLDAETVHQRARRKDPHISLATVYRTLALFKLLGLVEEHQFGESHSHFETVPESPHHHFTCLECGQVSEFPAPKVDAAMRQLCEDNGNSLEQIKLELNGICHACRTRKSSPTKPLSLKPLSVIPAGTAAQIRLFEGGHDFAARAIAMGFSPGAKVTVLQNDGRGPLLVGIQGTRIALGRGEAARIQVGLM